MDIAAAYQRSAFPALGISLETATTEPALRATLELAHWMREREQRRTAKRAERIAAGKWIENTNGERT
ncbi:hypothetical protein [Aromatoleum toluclasticum]|uniref:hypothetical protein n=1 Tax=Aromatoleum toluclasticum TaxID=92003 RepID=UPI000366EC81|nr:hypothetical protein [Aromatoleum toluclasticum]